jgi:glycosidase
VAYEFHVSKAARDRYEFDQSLFRISGNVIIPNFPAARAFAKRMNERADAVSYPDRVIHASELNAMGLIDEILHHAIEIYRRTVKPTVMTEAVAALTAQIGEDALARTLARFCDEFPPLPVYGGDQKTAGWLADYTDGIPNAEIALEELMMLWLANANPAFITFEELFDDGSLGEKSHYDEVVEGLQKFFGGEQGFGPDGQSLIAFLRAPALAEPGSLAAQLRWIRTRWGLVLTPFLDRLIVTLDVLHEEEVALWMRMHPSPGPTGTAAPGLGSLGGLENEYEKFSQDRDWMPRVVLLAKNSYVWLDQLSKRYARPIARLDEIPDEELESLSHRGFTGLWLIGLWERSRASRRIKQWRGNPEAAASAYSLMGYSIAEDLGGEAAWRNLRDRCSARGIRLSSDMVPNHMGIDSHWVMEHPEWFLQTGDSPYPAYSFTGGNVGDDERILVQIEDHYWDNTDAAVVFKRTDTHSGEARYIYHGNDGTSMPWNDTAQLDYLNPVVREAVIQTILHVARQFPIIRFDAAMTLARRHIQRLWYPEPGQGGAIPSRSEHAITRSEFDERMPVEFWREVVDRVAVEAPDTLLLAEAFWLLEGYFVRTLGMHRVYNSAFMNMLRDEENAGYRRVMKDTLEFDPEVLKRYVNFMSNPDERTAIDQFGGGDKYFGVATLLATLPGLPMIGHGQVEGFAEKYGMEYRRAYRDEKPDGWLIERHEREIFPLFHRRSLFAEVSDFLLYDFFTPDGGVDENVFAYSNRRDGEHSLVLYHNRYAETRGWIRTSSAYSVPDGAGGRKLVQRSLGEGLGLHGEPGWFTLLREHRSGLEYVRRSEEICREGLFAELHAYGCQVFTDVREVADGPSGQMARLCDRLGGTGVPSVSAALRELVLVPLHDAVRSLSGDGALRGLVRDGTALARAALPAGAVPLDLGLHGPRAAAPAAEGSGVATADAAPATTAEPTAEPTADATADAAPATLLDAATAAVERAAAAVAEVTGSGADPAAAAALFHAGMGATLRLPGLGSRRVNAGLVDEWAWMAIAGRLVARSLAAAAGGGSTADGSIEDLGLGPVIADVFRQLGADEGGAWRMVSLIRMLGHLPIPGSVADLPAAERAPALVKALIADETVRPFIRVNVWEGVAWFNRESFEQMLWWMAALEALAGLEDATAKAGTAKARLSSAEKLTTALAAAATAAGYQLDKLETAAAG